MKAKAVLGTAIMIVVYSASCLAGEATNPMPQGASVATQATDRADITTQSGQVYTSCKITRVEPDGITVMYAKGITKIPFADLPDDLQKKYHYDPQKARAYQEDTAKARTNQTLALQARQATERRLASVMSQVKEEQFFGEVSDIEADRALAWRVFMRYYGGNGSAGSARSRLARAKEPIMIHGLPKGLVDGATWDGKLYTAGVTQYETVEGGVKTVKRYATSKDLAVRLLSQDK